MSGEIKQVMPIIFSLIAAATGTQALSVGLDIQMQLGGRRYENKMPEGGKTNYDANELTFSAHVDVMEMPMPLPFITMGWAYSILDHSEKSWQAIDSSARVQGFEMGPEVVATWGLGDYSGYAKYRHTTASGIYIRDRFSIIGAAEKVEAKLRVSGWHLNFGLEYHVLPFLRVNLEVGRGTQMYVLKRVKVDGVESSLADNARPEDFNSNVILIGVTAKTGIGD
jgi:hypothetical protein